jgi:uncharacterized protein (DUF1015 family)
VAEVKAFCGIRYDPSVVGDLSQVTTPPFDIISEKRKRVYHERHPKNIIRLTLGESMTGDNAETNWYKRAVTYFEQWLREGTLVRDERPGFYLLRCEYVDKRGRERRRYGFTGLVRIEEPDVKVILGHELTFDDVIIDRLRLLETTRANLCPIFALYSDPQRDVVGALMSEEREPLATVEAEDGSTDTMWIVDDEDTCRLVSEAMRDQIIFIADGHHRYATARLYRNEMRRKLGTSSGSEPFDYTMMTLVALEDDGLAIYPPHRLVKGLRNFDGEAFLAELEEHFEVVPMVQSQTLREQVETLVRLMADGDASRPRFGVLLKDTAPRLLVLRDGVDGHPWLSGIRQNAPRELDIPILHRLVLEGMLDVGSASEEKHITYTPDEWEAAQLVQGDSVQVALLLNPPTPEDIKKVSLAGALMPHKSTYFYPKLLTGLVMNKMY